MAYAYLLILIVWPVVAFFVQVFLIAEGLLQISDTMTGGVAIFGIIVIWSISATQAIYERRHAMPQSEPTHVSFLTWELLGLTAAAYTLVCYVVLAFGVLPNMAPGERLVVIQFASKPSTSTTGLISRPLPSGEQGDLVIVGAVEQDNRPRGNTRLLLMFRDGAYSPEIKTDGRGEFEFRLPPGHWRFAGPLILGEESRTVNVAFKPEILKPEFQVGVGPPTRKLFMRIVVE